MKEYTLKVTLEVETAVNARNDKDAADKLDDFESNLDESIKYTGKRKIGDLSVTQTESDYEEI